MEKLSIGDIVMATWNMAGWNTAGVKNIVGFVVREPDHVGALTVGCRFYLPYLDGSGEVSYRMSKVESYIARELILVASLSELGIVNMWELAYAEW